VTYAGRRDRRARQRHAHNHPRGQNSRGRPLARYGTDAQKDTWLRAIATGRATRAFALSEEQAGSDAAHQETTARLDDRGYL
jgi:alkylation response protein AidB-like acyl-CoA dehydrogenase